MDVDNEIGQSLEGLLKRFRHDSICVQDMLVISLEHTQKMLFPLVKRGFIACDGKEYQSSSQIDIADTFYLTMEGINYLELRDRFLNRYWIRAVVVPIIVSLITTLLTLHVKGVLTP